jgi:hypothetical protein
VDAGGGSKDRDGRMDRTPPDEQQMRIGRSKIARGGQAADQGDLIGGSQSADSAYGEESPAALIGGTPLAGSDSIDLAPRFRPWSEPAAAGVGPIRCHFLRSVGSDGRLTEAQRSAVPTHRCAAFGDPLPLSLRQQELVCLQRVHVSCPRYVRGTLLANENPGTVVDDDQGKPMPLLSVVGVGLVLIAALVGAAAVFGMGPFGGAKPTATPVTVVTPTATARATVTATATATVRPTQTPSGKPSPSASLKPSATPTIAPTPAATATWPPGATASRMSLLVPCTAQANCWIYKVRGPGPAPSGNGSTVSDTVPNIAKWFGVSQNGIYDLSPWARSGIAPGDELKIPPPTR